MSDDSNSQKDRAESNGLGSIGQELASFVTQIEALNTSLPLVMTMMQAANDSERKHFKKFLETNGELLEEQGKEKVYRFEINHVHELRRRERKLERVVVGRKILPRSFVVSLVSQFDFFVGRLLRALYELRPELLNALERQLSFAELVSFGSLERAKEYVLEKEVETLLRKSHPEQFGWLENKFSVPLRKDLPIWPTFVELTERRNLFVHCNGIVSSQYLEECRSHNVVFERQPQLGEELGVTPEYYRLAYRCIFEIGVKLAQVLWRKIVPDDLERADFSLVDVTYDLLQQEQYELAAALLDFATNTLKRYSSENVRRILLVNHAQAYKWGGKPEICKSITEKEDWSACGDKFQLAVAVLVDDFDHAATWMRRIGRTGEAKEHDYKEWPLFQEFRKSEPFRAAYAEVFGQSYETVQDPGRDSKTREVADAEPNNGLQADARAADP